MIPHRSHIQYCTRCHDSIMRLMRDAKKVLKDKRSSIATTETDQELMESVQMEIRMLEDDIYAQQVTIILIMRFRANAT